jgi:hypothetical protein
MQVEDSMQTGHLRMTGVEVAEGLCLVRPLLSEFIPNVQLDSDTPPPPHTHTFPPGKWGNST